MRAWQNYNSDAHRDRHCGYANPAIVRDAAEDMATMLARVCQDEYIDRDRITFLCVDGSSTVLTAATFLEFGRGQITCASKAAWKIPLPVNKDGGICEYNLRIPHFIVVCDDFLNVGGTARKISLLLGRPIDLLMVIKQSHIDIHATMNSMYPGKEVVEFVSARRVGVLTKHTRPVHIPYEGKKEMPCNPYAGSAETHPPIASATSTG